MDAVELGAGIRAALAAYSMSANVARVASSFLLCVSLINRAAGLAEKCFKGSVDPEVLRGFVEQAAINLLKCCEELEAAADR